MVFIIAFLVSQFTHSAPVDKLAVKVIELRKEVELLNDQYKTERERVLNDIKVLSIQKAELASNIRSEEIRKRQLLEKLQDLKNKMGETVLISEELKPLIQRLAHEMVAHIESGLPFKKKERLEAVEVLMKKLNKKEISGVKAANQLWALIEDEKRLSRETSLHKQSIMLEGDIKMVEVAKIGMVFMYFKTGNEEVGMAVQKNGSWSFEKYQDTEKKEKTLVIFESLKKQIRQGHFELPTVI